MVEQGLHVRSQFILILCYFPKPSRYPCRSSDCKEAFAMLQQRMQHEKDAHDGKPLVCNICFKTFSTQCHYVRHMGTHTERQTCDVCGKECKNANSLRKHRLIHVNGGAVCQYCGKTYQDANILRMHEKIHKNDRQVSGNLWNSLTRWREGVLRSSHGVSASSSEIKTETET